MTDKTAFDHKAFLRTLSSRPGVYRMFNARDEVIYVGKAKNLKNRVSSYFNKAHDTKTLRLVSHIRRIEVTVTHTEGEALLLEDTLIKQHKPRYNVLLRDDKSFPYIYISTQQEYPRIAFYRGSTRKPGTFLGPYPNSGAVRQALNLIYRLFRIRQCRDSYFANRSRPCLQYQIKRCSGPCVGLISPVDYARDVDDTILFLKGKTQTIIDRLVAQMEAASAKLEFEQAAVIRDQIGQLRTVMEKQHVSSAGSGKIDVLACTVKGDQACVQVFYFRSGVSLGNKAFFPRIPASGTDSETDTRALEGEILQAFVSQYYLGNEIPAEIIVSRPLEEAALISDVLSEKSANKLIIKDKVRGERARWLAAAKQNAETALDARLASKSSYQKRLLALKDTLGLEALPERIECFDISHTQGQETVASCVVFDRNGPLKSDYRRFNIKGITPGDDYAAMAQALTRRYERVLKEDGQMPNLILIDGGKGQLGRAADVLFSLLQEPPLMVGVSKGPGRKAGLEWLHFVDNGEPLKLPANSPALMLILQVRDEAHRFAITGHRQRARKQQTASSLEGIEGLGPKRRQLLLKNFGGLQGVKKAGIEDLASLNGISRQLATRIYEHFHSQ